MPIPQSLQDRLRKRQVIPFVGAGVSMSVLDQASKQPVFPSWHQLLSGAADRLHKETKKADADLVRSLLNVDPPDFLEAANRARKALGPVWFEFLKDSLAVEIERIAPESLNLARQIWRLGSDLVITTNYDDVLAWAGPPHVDQWNIEAPIEQAGFLQRELKHSAIWHLHGRISHASQMILSPDGYQLLYPETNHDSRVQYEVALTTLRHLIASKSLLFIGFSLNDEDFGLQLKGVHDIYQGGIGPHYAVVLESQAGRVRDLNAGIEPIAVPHFGEPVLTLLGDMQAFVEPAIGRRSFNFGQTQGSLIPDYSPHQPVFYVPFKQKGADIVGQQQVLEKVRKQLTEGKRTAIGQTAAFRGLGGLGKTQLAVEYAYRYRNEYPNGVIWINADQDIEAQLIDIAEKARWIAPESDHKYKIQIAQQRIRSYSDCLIVFDNLENRAVIEPYLPEPEANPHILVTSRPDHVGFQPIALDPLDVLLSRELLIKEAGRVPDNDDEVNALHGIVELLGGLPLALELAGAYLGHRRSVTFQQYYELLNKDLKSALPKHVESFTKHEADLYSTLQLSEGLLREEPYLRDILDLLTWSGSASMSVDLMSHLLNLTDEAALTGSLSLGAELRLLQGSEKSNSYSLHRLVGEVRRTEIPLEDRREWVNSICNRLGDWFQESKGDFSQLTKFESEIDHLKKWQENATQFAPFYASRLMWLQAYPAYHRGWYLESRNYVSEAQRILKHLGDTNLELQAHLLNDLAFTNLKLGQLVPAQQMLIEALQLRRKLFREPHRDIATSLSNLGRWYGEQGDIELALDYSRQALDMRRKVFGNIHPEIATALGNLGSWYGEQGDIELALEYTNKALEMWRQLFGNIHPEIATALGNLGSWYGKQGDIELALEYTNKALEMSRQVFGNIHPEIATALNNLGAFYGEQGNIKAALQYSEQALNMDRELLGDTHPQMVTSLRSTGYWYGRDGNIERALDYSKQGLAMSRELVGEQHHSTIEMSIQVARYLIRLGRRKDAYDIVAHFLTQVSSDDPSIDSLKRLEQHLLSKSIQKGFRQPPKKRKGKAKKKRRQ